MGGCNSSSHVGGIRVVCVLEEGGVSVSCTCLLEFVRNDTPHEARHSSLQRRHQLV